MKYLAIGCISLLIMWFMITNFQSSHYYDCSLADKQILLDDFQKCVKNRESYNDVGDCKKSYKRINVY